MTGLRGVRFEYEDLQVEEVNIRTIGSPLHVPHSLHRMMLRYTKEPHKIARRAAMTLPYDTKPSPSASRVNDAAHARLGSADDAQAWTPRSGAKAQQALHFPCASYRGEGCNGMRTMVDGASSVADCACVRYPREDPPLPLLIVNTGLPQAWPSRDPQAINRVLPDREFQAFIQDTPSFVKLTRCCMLEAFAPSEHRRSRDPTTTPCLRSWCTA
ncbi:hypothetical protein FKP32DRAFT_178671 [Trametes sanguinea]|nr:hypothetical protein FKP32DRAFT_178671 [Trametes sanguinea]